MTCQHWTLRNRGCVECDAHALQAENDALRQIVAAVESLAERLCNGSGEAMDCDTAGTLIRRAIAEAGK